MTSSDVDVYINCMEHIMADYVSIVSDDALDEMGATILESFGQRSEISRTRQSNGAEEVQAYFN